MPERLFVFIQLEFPWALGPADGRYLLRAQPTASPSAWSCSTRSRARAAERRRGEGGSPRCAGASARAREPAASPSRRR